MTCDFAARSNTTIRPTGTIIAPPAPWSTRIATSSPKVWLAAQPSDAIVNIAMAESSTQRYPKRSVIQLLKGISTATVTR